MQTRRKRPTHPHRDLRPADLDHIRGGTVQTANVGKMRENYSLPTKLELPDLETTD